MQARLLWTALTALGAWLGFANPYLQLPLAVLGLPLGLAALGRRAQSPREAFQHAWIAGSLACLGCLAWVYWPVHHFGGVHWLLALPVPVLLAMAMGVYFGLFGLGAHYASNRLSPALALLFFGASWCTMEFGMSCILSGFSWLTLCAAFVPWPAFVQSAAWVGSMGLSGLFVESGTGAARIENHQIPFDQRRTGKTPGRNLSAQFIIEVLRPDNRSVRRAETK